MKDGDCMEVVLLNPYRKWDVSLFWRCGGVALCAGYICCVSSGGQSSLCIENGHLEEQNGVVSGVFSLHWSALNKHFMS